MCSLDNIKGYVKIKDVLNIYIKYGILKLNYKLFLRYLYCKYKFFPKRPSERYASALTKMNLSNKIHKYYGKIKLKDYISNLVSRKIN